LDLLHEICYYVFIVFVFTFYAFIIACEIYIQFGALIGQTWSNNESKFIWNMLFALSLRYLLKCAFLLLFLNNHVYKLFLLLNYVLRLLFRFDNLVFVIHKEVCCSVQYKYKNISHVCVCVCACVFWDSECY